MAVPDSITLYKVNDQVVEVTGLKNNVTGAFLNAATVTATLKDKNGNAVTGLSSLTLAFLAGTNGNYRGQVEQTFDPAPGRGYVLHIDSDEGGVVGHWEIPVIVEVRRT